MNGSSGKTGPKKTARAELVSVNQGVNRAFLEVDDVAKLFDTLRANGIRADLQGDRVVVPLTYSLPYEVLLSVLQDSEYIVDAT
jgi:hypothetical protein